MKANKYKRFEATLKNGTKVIAKAAKKYGYRVSSCGNSSIGCVLSARFFMLLQKIKIN